MWDCRWPLRPEPIQEAAAGFIGTHDFTSFAATDPDRSERITQNPVAVSNVRTIFASEWLQRDGLLVYRVTGNGFLHHMVRNLVGTCVDAAAGRLDPAVCLRFLAARDRRQAGATAPPQGPAPGRGAIRCRYDACGERWPGMIFRERSSLPHMRVARLAENTAVHRAFRWIHLQEPRIRAWQHDIVAIPAPPFLEARTGRVVCRADE